MAEDFEDFEIFEEPSEGEELDLDNNYSDDTGEYMDYLFDDLGDALDFDGDEETDAYGEM